MLSDLSAVTMVTKSRSVSPGPATFTRSKTSTKKSSYNTGYSTYGSTLTTNTSYESGFLASSEYSSVDHGRYSRGNTPSRQARSSVDREMYSSTLRCTEDVGRSRSRGVSMDRDNSRYSVDRHQRGMSCERTGTAPRLYDRRGPDTPAAPKINVGGYYTRDELNNSVLRRDTTRASSVSRYNVIPSCHDRASSVSRYMVPSHHERASSVSHYTTPSRHERASSVSRYTIPSRHERASSVSRNVTSTDYSAYTRPRYRSASVSRFDDIAIDTDNVIRSSIAGLSRYDSYNTDHATSSSSRLASYDNYDTDRITRSTKGLTAYDGSSVDLPSYDTSPIRLSRYDTSAGLTRYDTSTSTSDVDHSAKYFSSGGDDWQVSTLPNGMKCYSRYSLQGHGDKNEANSAIEQINQRTLSMEQNATALENFVRRNRHLFPEETTIYQRLLFYLLSEAELLAMGESPDAEIYGVKIKETLVVPYGNQITEILQRHLGTKSAADIEIEYKDTDGSGSSCRRNRHVEYVDREEDSEEQKQAWLKLQEENQQRRARLEEDDNTPSTPRVKVEHEDLQLKRKEIEDYETDRRARAKKRSEDNENLRKARLQAEDEARAKWKAKRQDKEDERARKKARDQIEEEDRKRRKQRQQEEDEYRRKKRHHSEEPDYRALKTVPHGRFLSAGLDYDSASMARSRHSSIGSDQESTYTGRSSVSSRRKRLDTAPQFTAKLRSKRVEEGSTVRFNCSVSGLPLPQAIWFKGNNIVNQGGRVSMTVSQTVGYTFPANTIH